MKKIVFLLCLTFPVSCFATPSNSVSIPNSFSANTVIQSSQANANFNEVQTKYNAHTHTDVTSLGTVTTGTWNADTVAIGYGGTGQTTATASFDALAPTTTQGDVIYHNGTDNVRLAAGTSGYFLQTQGASANPQWTQAIQYTDSRIYVGSFTIDISTTGPQTITNVGFTPKNVIFFASVNATTGRASWGLDNGSTYFNINDQYTAVAGQNGVSASQSVTIVVTGSDLLDSKITSFNSDGFVITKTKTGSPTGTATVGFMAFR